MLPLHISAGKVTNQKTSIAFLHGLIGFWRTLLAFRDGSCNVKKSYTNTPGIIFSSIIQGNQTRSNYFTPRMNCLNAPCAHNGLADPLQAFGCKCNLCSRLIQDEISNIEWVSMTFGTDMHGPLRMGPLIPYKAHLLQIN